MSLSDALVERVKYHEGYRANAYQDSVGVWTIGYGTNLQTLTLDKELAERWLLEELEGCREAVDDYIGGMGLDNARREVLIEMAYNLGFAGLMKFRRMWAAIQNHDFETAAAEMLDSKWARQVGRRADSLAELMRAGR